MAFYGYLYRSHANLARSINNKSLYELLWLYGIYAALDRIPQNEQVLLMDRAGTGRRSLGLGSDGIGEGDIFELVFSHFLEEMRYLQHAAC